MADSYAANPRLIAVASFADVRLTEWRFSAGFMSHLRAPEASFADVRLTEWRAVTGIKEMIYFQRLIR